MLLHSLYFSRFLPNCPRSLSSFDSHARWQPMTQSTQSRLSYEKIEDCEQCISLPSVVFAALRGCQWGKAAVTKTAKKTLFSQ